MVLVIRKVITFQLSSKREIPAYGLPRFFRAMHFMRKSTAFLLLFPKIFYDLVEKAAFVHTHSRTASVVLTRQKIELSSHPIVVWIFLPVATAIQSIGEKYGCRLLQSCFVKREVRDDG